MISEIKDNVNQIIIDSQFQLNPLEQNYSFTFQLPQIIAIRKFIKLSFLYLPNTQYLILNDETVQFISDNNLHLIIIPQGYYTLEQLRQSMQSQIQAFDNTFTISLNTQLNQFTFKSTLFPFTLRFLLSVDDTQFNLYKIIGSQTANRQSSLVSPYILQFQQQLDFSGERALHIYIDEIEKANYESSTTQIKSTFYIPLTSNINNVCVLQSDDIQDLNVVYVQNQQTLQKFQVNLYSNQRLNEPYYINSDWYCILTYA